MLFCITGASGSGKSACLSGLKQKHADLAWYEFDDLPFTPTTVSERQIGTEYWMQAAAENQTNGKSTAIVGSCVPGEVLACPSAPAASSIRFLLLDCNDVVRVDRIRRRDFSSSAWASQEMLNWAAWQRMHAVDPQWRPDVIRNECAPDMVWDRWNTWHRGDPRWQVDVLDTTYLTVSQTIDEVSAWLKRHSTAVPMQTDGEVRILTRAAGA